jgi:hypothetical protein
MLSSVAERSAAAVAAGELAAMGLAVTGAAEAITGVGVNACVVATGDGVGSEETAGRVARTVVLKPVV